jgi:hypothetical protein
MAPPPPRPPQQPPPIPIVGMGSGAWGGEFEAGGGGEGIEEVDLEVVDVVDAVGKGGGEPLCCVSVFLGWGGGGGRV